jgi:hypothetical protein
MDPNQVTPFPPHRVVCDHQGYAITYQRAQREHVPVDVIFVRDDGWTVGAPIALRAVAQNLWKDHWVREFRRQDDGTWRMLPDGQT